MQSILTTLLGGLLCMVAAKAIPAQGQVFLTMDQALKLAFPSAETQRTTAYLTKAEILAITNQTGQSTCKAVVHPYTAVQAGKVVGTAYFDNHKVRSLRETLMVVVRPDGTVGRVELLAFGEPKEYIPKSKWYQQFNKQALSDELRLRRTIRPMTGATLTARATTDCVRRILAIHAAIQKRTPTTTSKPKPTSRPEKPSRSKQPTASKPLKLPKTRTPKHEA